MPVPNKKYYSKNTPLLEEIWDATESIYTARDLRRYASSFQHPSVGSIILCALDYFAECKVLSSGRRDGRKIAEHISAGFGPRISDDTKLNRQLCLAISAWVGTVPSPGVPLGNGTDMWARKAYGASMPKDLAWDLAGLVGKRVRSREAC